MNRQLVNRSIVFALLISGLLVFTRASYAERFGDVSVVSIPLLEDQPETCRGYATHRLRVKNEGSSDRHVKIQYPMLSYSSYGSSINSIAREMDLSPGQTVYIDLLQPAIDCPSNGFLVTVNGREERLNVGNRSEHGSAQNGHYSSSSSTPVVLCDRSISGDFRDKLAANTVTSPATSSTSSATHPTHGLVTSSSSLPVEVQAVRAAMGARDWPTEWIFYSRFDGLLLPQAQYEQMPPEVQTAIGDYLSTGGLIWITTDEDDPPKSLETLRNAEGFGELMIGSQDAKRIPEFFSLLQNTTSRKSGNLLTPEQANERLTVVDQQRVPVRTLSIFLILYAFAVGPVLQVILKRKRIRIWSLWIIPAVSVGICVLVAGWSFFSEGVSGHANFRLVSLIDQPSGRVSTVGIAGFYSPLTDGRGLRFSENAVLQPQWGSDGSYSYRRRNEPRRSLTVDWTSGQHFQRDWLQAKTPLHFRIWKAERRREQLMIRQADDGTVSVTNALGADLTDLVVHLPDGSWAAIDSIAAGSTAELSECNQRMPPTLLNETLQRNALSSQRGFDGVSSENFLPGPGGYFCKVDGHPMVETAITSPKTDRGQSIIVGRFELEE